MSTLFNTQLGVVTESGDLQDGYSDQLLHTWRYSGMTGILIQAGSEGRAMDVTQIKRWAAGIQGQAAGKHGLWYSCSANDAKGDIDRLLGAWRAAPNGQGVALECERCSEQGMLNLVREYRSRPEFQWVPVCVWHLGDRVFSPDTITQLRALRCSIALETYWNQTENFNPVTCWHRQIAGGWKPGEIHLSFWYGGDYGNGNKRAADYNDVMEYLNVEIVRPGLHPGIWHYRGVDLDQADLRYTANWWWKGWTL